MSDGRRSEDFYTGLPPIRGFANVADPVGYRPLPDDWLIGVADVEDSTKAVQAKRFKAVNLAGASVIISFASLGAHPLGSTLIIAFDVLIIWGLTTRAELFVPGGIADEPRAPRPEPSGRPYA